MRFTKCMDFWKWTKRRQGQETVHIQAESTYFKISQRLTACLKEKWEKNVGLAAMFHEQLRETMLTQQVYLIKFVLVAIIKMGTF